MAGETDIGEATVPLGAGRTGLRGRVVSVGIASRTGETATPFDVELERRLLEMGFVEGARVEILREGFIGRDPIAVRVDDMCVAIRRREANAVLVRRDEAGESPAGEARRRE